MKLDELTDDVWKDRYFRFLKHTAAIRVNQDILGHVFLSLAEHPPNAWGAKEGISEIEFDDQIAVMSISTRDGGVWETWHRDAIKYGDLDTTNSYAVWERRSLDYAIE